MSKKQQGIPEAKEAQTQVAIFQWVAVMTGRYPELELLFHVPNGGSRNFYEAINLKRQGVKPGVPDMILPVPKGKYHGLFLELKRLGGRKPSEDQARWIEKLTEQGYKAVVAFGFDEAIETIKSYLDLK